MTPAEVSNAMHALAKQVNDPRLFENYAVDSANVMERKHQYAKARAEVIVLDSDSESDGEQPPPAKKRPRDDDGEAGRKRPKVSDWVIELGSSSDSDDAEEAQLVSDSESKAEEAQLVSDSESEAPIPKFVTKQTPAQLQVSRNELAKADYLYSRDTEIDILKEVTKENLVESQREYINALAKADYLSGKDTDSE